MRRILDHVLDAKSGRRKDPSSSFPGTASENEGQTHGHQHYQPFNPTLGPEFLIADSGTYPRLAHLSDGSLLAISTRRAPEDNAVRILQISRAKPGWDEDNSSDIHATSSQPRFDPHWGEVARGSGDLDNGFILEFPLSHHHHHHENGKNTPTPAPVLAAFRNHDLDPSSSSYTHFRITTCYSLDRGRTWSFLSQAAEQQAGGGLGLWEPFMRLQSSSSTPTPTIHLTYSAELSPQNQETFLTTLSTPSSSSSSTQQPLDQLTATTTTWHPTPPRCLTCHHPKEDLRDGMQGIASLGWFPLPLDFNGGQEERETELLIMVMETTRRDGGLMSVEYVISSDGGETWGEDRGVVYVPRGRGRGRNAGAPQIASVDVEGEEKKQGKKKLAVIFMTDEDIPEDQLSWPGRAGVKMVFCEGLEFEEDEGNRKKKKKKLRWSHPPLEVSGDPAAWPGILESGNGKKKRPGEVLVSYAKGGMGVVGRRVRF